MNKQKKKEKQTKTKEQDKKDKRKPGLEVKRKVSTTEGVKKASIVKQTNLGDKGKKKSNNPKGKKKKVPN
eukprot:TRINITY_DN4763_c0_g1_i1.p2 TRINITY_DN4763_c0_g1~~TRINITY_DN4763_c0_g1_i1.p2  ORF type:complete len:70 (-),score=30.20 TRINITY_DN4763_c0_g1_i1:48-257(-)